MSEKERKIFLMLVTIIILVLAIVLGIFYSERRKSFRNIGPIEPLLKTTAENPLSIGYMKKKNYPGSEIKIEKILSDGVNYKQYIVSYYSDGLKIYGLLTVPIGQKPKDGFPVIIFNHGYIPPQQYRTTERYVVYVDSFARNGFIVFKPDYRGNGESEGKAESAYYSPAYTIDVLNAVSSIKKYKDANPQKIGMWGHSMGGNITLRAMVISKEIKAGIIWSGVVGTYDELLNKWRRRNVSATQDREIQGHISSIRENLINKYGTPNENPKLWESIDPRFHLLNISAPIELHHSLNDSEVPELFSESLKNDLQKLGKNVQLFIYPGSDHNISEPNFSLAMQRSIDFFNKFLK